MLPLLGYPTMWCALTATFPFAICTTNAHFDTHQILHYLNLSHMTCSNLYQWGIQSFFCLVTLLTSYCKNNSRVKLLLLLLLLPRFAWPLMFCLEVQTRLSGLTRTSINKIMFALLCFLPLPLYVKEKYARDLSRNAASSSSTS